MWPKSRGADRNNGNGKFKLEDRLCHRGGLIVVPTESQLEKEVPQKTDTNARRSKKDDAGPIEAWYLRASDRESSQS